MQLSYLIRGGRSRRRRVKADTPPQTYGTTTPPTTLSVWRRNAQTCLTVSRARHSQKKRPQDERKRPLVMMVTCLTGKPRVQCRRMWMLVSRLRISMRSLRMSGSEDESWRREILDEISVFNRAMWKMVRSSLVCCWERSNDDEGWLRSGNGMCQNEMPNSYL